MRWPDEGECGICAAERECVSGHKVDWLKEEPTGVMSRSESASLADVAASISSSHRLPIAGAAP